MITVPIKQGGLYRCCLETLNEDSLSRTELPKEGETLKCKWSEQWMRYRDGYWEWAQDL